MIWLDDVELTKNGNSTNLLDNPSFDDNSAWTAIFDDSNAPTVSFQTVDIFSVISGSYTIELKVTDDLGTESSPFASNIDLPSCQ
ncbi:MAG: hypothetical protein IPJ88_08660 [Myxococcales bacterium]|nr:MAG: hypothetical protein IPJ88_08660 [Myxococcales bacterium]